MSELIFAAVCLSFAQQSLRENGEKNGLTAVVVKATARAGRLAAKAGIVPSAKEGRKAALSRLTTLLREGTIKVPSILRAPAEVTPRAAAKAALKRCLGAKAVGDYPAANACWAEAAQHALRGLGEIIYHRAGEEGDKLLFPRGEEAFNWYDVIVVRVGSTRAAIPVPVLAQEYPELWGALWASRKNWRLIWRNPRQFDIA